VKCSLDEPYSRGTAFVRSVHHRLHELASDAEVLRARIDVMIERARRGPCFPSDLSKSGAIKKTADGFTYLDPAHFHEYFAADLSAEQAAFMARSQVPTRRTISKQ
jgi:hypothetical protein